MPWPSYDLCFYTLDAKWNNRFKSICLFKPSVTSYHMHNLAMQLTVLTDFYVNAAEKTQPS